METETWDRVYLVSCLSHKGFTRYWAEFEETMPLKGHGQDFDKILFF